MRRDERSRTEGAVSNGAARPQPSSGITELSAAEVEQVSGGISILILPAIIIAIAQQIAKKVGPE